MNKKAFAMFNALNMIPRIIVTCIALLVVLLIMTQFVFSNVNVREIQAKVIANRILYSATSIAYTNSELHRTYPGVIDIERFNEAVLESTLKIESNRKFAVKLDLESSSASVFYNQLWFERWLPLAGLKGTGGAYIYEQKQNVLIYRDGETRVSTLIITVLIPNA